MNTPLSRLAAVSVLLLLGACQSLRPPLETVAHVDLPRFMGDWYVIASIPTVIERDAYAAVESYRLDADGTIDTTFTYRKGSFDGPRKRYNPRGFVFDRQSNATWGMRFVWPIKADYRIAYLSDDYSRTIIARQARDYVWIMARTPTLAPSEYGQLVQRVAQLGYDTGKLRQVPQRP
ncbi:MAG TPA: lipocalin family protein [Steroidobacteraceae bacterium]|nr:lipocalin family protein [Steroidobacteraceae bacterium]